MAGSANYTNIKPLTQPLVDLPPVPTRTVVTPNAGSSTPNVQTVPYNQPIGGTIKPNDPRSPEVGNTDFDPIAPPSVGPPLPITPPRPVVNPVPRNDPPLPNSSTGTPNPAPITDGLNQWQKGFTPSQVSDMSSLRGVQGGNPAEVGANAVLGVLKAMRSRGEPIKWMGYKAITPGLNMTGKDPNAYVPDSVLQADPRFDPATGTTAGTFDYNPQVSKPGPHMAIGGVEMYPGTTPAANQQNLNASPVTAQSTNGQPSNGNYAAPNTADWQTINQRLGPPPNEPATNDTTGEQKPTPNANAGNLEDLVNLYKAKKPITWSQYASVTPSFSFTGSNSGLGQSDPVPRFVLAADPRFSGTAPATKPPGQGDDGRLPETDDTDGDDTPPTGPDDDSTSQGGENPWELPDGYGADTKWTGAQTEFTPMDYTKYQMATPENLTKLANEGYGQNWMRSVFEGAMTPLSEQYGNYSSSIKEQAGRSGFGDSGFVDKMLNFGRQKLTSAGIGTIGNIQSQNEDVKQTAQQQLSDIGMFNTAQRSQIDDYNLRMVTMRTLFNKWFAAQKLAWNLDHKKLF